MEKKILYIDDEVFISRCMVEHLILFGYNVTFTSDIDELFELLGNDTYELLIIDIIMPLPTRNNSHVKFSKKEIVKMNGGFNTGEVLAEKIWMIPKYQNLPILFLSAKSNGSLDNIKGKNIRYIRKPELSINIANEIEELLNE